MLDHSVFATASLLNKYYQDEDRACEMAMIARRAEQVAREQIRATFDTLTWTLPATPEETFIVAVVLGSKLWGVHRDEIDDDLLITMNRMVRNLVRGMQAQFSAEQFAALPKWVRDDPVIARRVRLSPLKADEASEA